MKYSKQKEYNKLREIRVNYANANLIFDLNDADTTYLKLRLNEEKAYLKFKEATVNEFSFNRYHKPVIQHRISNIKSRLQRKGVNVLCLKCMFLNEIFKTK